MASLDGKDIVPEPQNEYRSSGDSSSSSHHHRWLIGTTTFLLRAIRLFLYPVFSLVAVIHGRPLWKTVETKALQETGGRAHAEEGLSDTSWLLIGQQLRHRATEQSKSNRIPVPRDLWPISDDEQISEESSSTQSTLQELEEACNVCTDSFGESSLCHIGTCRHAFCKDCLQTYVLGRLRERRYPIVCPVCVVVGIQDHYVDQSLIEHLDIPADEYLILLELQLAVHAIPVTCPRCRETMQVDRTQYLTEEIINCPLPHCQHRWCKACQKVIALSDTAHRCKKNKLDKLARRKGWRYCPGCRIPVQKVSGCNHITCRSPGCNVHFCYRCGELIIDASGGGNIGHAVSAHYGKCRQFRRRLLPRRSCTIQ